MAVESPTIGLMAIPNTGEVDRPAADFVRHRTDGPLTTWAISWSRCCRETEDILLMVQKSGNHQVRPREGAIFFKKGFS